jgi:uncharacterized protein
MPEVVSNTGPIIALASIGQLDLLRELFGQVLIPPAVHAEIKDDISVALLSTASWIQVQAVQDVLARQLLREELDAGESEAIVLAQEVAADLVLLDERAATRKARTINLQTIGTLGVLLMAKRNGLVTRLKPLLDDLHRAGFHMSNILYRQVLQSAGEGENNSAEIA